MKAGFLQDARMEPGRRAGEQLGFLGSSGQPEWLPDVGYSEAIFCGIHLAGSRRLTDLACCGPNSRDTESSSIDYLIAQRALRNSEDRAQSAHRGERTQAICIRQSLRLDSTLTEGQLREGSSLRVRHGLIRRTDRCRVETYRKQLVYSKRFLALKSGGSDTAIRANSIVR